MAKNHQSVDGFENLILARLSPQSRDGLRRHLQPIELEIRQPIYQPNQAVGHAYFLEVGMISVVSNMKDGAMIEVGTIGREGMVGAFLLLGIQAVPYQHFVQIAGRGHQIDSDTLKKVALQDSNLRDLILRYQAIFQTQTMQSVACNGLHSVQQRCCRWLLMSHDRMPTDKLSLTHEFLALMLGVRRASVTEILRPLQEHGWVQSHRGEITILDRKGLESGTCECYRLVVEQQKMLLES